MMSTATIERFLPIGPTSLSSDAPGWHGTQQAPPPTTTTSSTKLQTTASSSSSSTTTTTGPRCWKCKGTGILKQKRQCPVCTGVGILTSKKQASPSSQNNANDKGMMITRQRRAYPGWKGSSGPIAHAVQQCHDFIQRYRHQRNDDADSDIRRHPLYLLFQSNQNVTSSDDDDGFNNKAGVSTRLLVTKEEELGQTTTTTTTNDDYPWLPLHPGEQLCNLVGTWRILQKVKCHRWTTDDLVTAFMARKELTSLFAIEVENFNYLDLGCGNGSVLQMVIWSLMDRMGSCRRLYAVGLEARLEAVKLARRSLSFNIGPTKGDNYGSTNSHGVVAVKVIHDDFRRLEQHHQPNDGDVEYDDALRQIQRRKYHLVTGTPPYFRVDFTTTTTTNDTGVTTTTSAVINQGGMPTSLQSAPARCEFRGGIEAYCRAAAAVMADDGVFVVCENTLNRPRVYDGAKMAGLEVDKIQPVRGKRGKGGRCLFDVFVMVKKRTFQEMRDTGRDEMGTVVLDELCVRDEGGQWTMEYGKLLETMSIPAKCNVSV